MKAYELHDTVLFVLSNQDLKRLKQTVQTVDTKVVGSERSLTFSIISEEGYTRNKQVQEMVKMKVEMMKQSTKKDESDDQQ